MANIKKCIGMYKDDFVFIASLFFSKANRFFIFSDYSYFQFVFKKTINNYKIAINFKIDRFPN